MKKTINIILITFLLFFLIGCINNSVSAKKNNGYLSKLPNQMLGNWYTYDNEYGISKINISNKNLRKNKPKKTANSNKYWNAVPFNSHGYRWISKRYWEEKNMINNFMNVHKFGKYYVLSLAAMGDVEVQNHYYRSKKLAKHFHKKRYPKFLYEF